MESNSVCNHSSDWQNWTTATKDSDLWITSMITGRIGRHEVLLLIYQNYSMTKFEKEIRHWLYIFMKKKKKKFSTKCTTTVQAYDTYCPLTQAWHVNSPVTFSNYKHNKYTVPLVLKIIGLVITNQVWEFCFSSNYPWNYVKHTCS